MQEITLSPVSRVSGLLSINLLVDEQHRVSEANCIGEQFRGFELMLRDRHITDAPYFTQRVCGICSMAYGYISSRLIAQLYGVTPTPEIVLLQQLMLGAEFLQNHIRHFYLLALPDYLNHQLLPEHHPNTPATRGNSRFSDAEQRHFVEDYFMSMEYSRKSHEMLALFGGKIPHQHGMSAAGVAVIPDAALRLEFLALLKDVQTFIKTTLLPDVYRLAEVYRDYYNIGTRPARLISYGLFDPNFGGHYPSGIYNEGQFLPLNTTEITESILFSYYRQVDAQTVPAPEKPGAYTWIKAARYHGHSYEGGPLARKVLQSPENYRNGVGVLQRLIARCEETDHIATWMEEWINQLPAQGKYILPLIQPQKQQAVQIGDAPRGPLLHSINAAGDKIVDYNIITPSNWNFSPKDDEGHRGPLEETLIGLRVEPDQTQIGQVVRSFDPCLNCATQLIDLTGQNKMTVQILV